ncbi:MAG: S8 family serine peptidase [Deltaproteobacteria bacterium]|nr:S8 family serine peptidase [Deltaproteobacteria bacterium]
MFASRARPPYLLAAAGLGVALLVCDPKPTTPARERLVKLHVKLRAEGAPLAIAATEGMRIEPMFSAMTIAAHDDRARWVIVTTATAGADDEIVKLLEADPAVEQAFVPPHTSLPTTERAFSGREDERCPVTTPSFEPLQGYLGPAPQGIDAPAAWRLGHRGAGVWFADIEGGWNAAHEDLPGHRIEHAGGIPIDDRSWRAHGTAVLGEVVGLDNGKGVTGIAPDVEKVFTSSIGGTTVAGAIDTAASRLRAGDVLLIELQSTGPRGRYLPVEYWDDVYDTIKAHTQRGVIVIEAAGNGGENLDHKSYKGKLDRKVRDSGAIMIGAGGPAREGWSDRERLDFSNYGTRVDVQGWGRKVATLDYGDLQRCDPDTTDRHYTDEFSGTSSASPIVAGAAIILEGVAREKGAVIPPAELRELLRATGSPQLGDTSQQIGPRPDLAKALEALSER